MSKFANKKFWTDAFDRCLSSFAQGILASSALDQIGVLNIDWVQVLSLGGGYALFSLLTSIGFRGSEGQTTVESVKTVTVTANPTEGDVIPESVDSVQTARHAAD